MTGSCYWLTTPVASFIVDCGMFQGNKTLQALNYEPFPFDASKIDFVLQTHAHIDHAGLLQKLYKAGFRGPVHMTAGTHDLLSFMLADSAFIQEMETEQLNRRNARRGRPEVTPAYTRDDAADCLKLFRAEEYERWLEAAPAIRFHMWNAGHILGSASIEVEIAQPESDKPLRLLFYGDIGPDHKLFHPDPEASSSFDYVISESTYGGRTRSRRTEEQRREILAHEVCAALQAGGNLLIPSFAVKRTQELLADITILQESGVINHAPIFLDSPLAIRATEVFERHAHELEHLSRRPHLIDNPNIRFTETVDESKAINRIRGEAIILAASGMCDAGCIRHHLHQHLWRPDSTVLLVGYQAPGTLGHLITDGVEKVTIQGDPIKVRARIREIDVYSGHADHGELVDWIKERMPIHRLILTHGDPEARVALREAMVATGFPADHVVEPEIDDVFDLVSGQLEPAEKSLRARRVEPAVISHLDWHNDTAEFLLDIREEIDQAADERSKQVVIRRLRRAPEES
ncbi:MBL fold metallo-hydrolase [Breoghania sp.]|uniref:MBL fold metallo-hydrolase n=1 Tax=Breoghania sp. TaxID=2065378 RepID=UPI00260FEFCD|nr:MBL fold metallo-hydrolase [Breoghania sp.]MDJ0930037.1 MBL fold metallo-hydrolase [Breoghania sp.]